MKQKYIIHIVIIWLISLSACTNTNPLQVDTSNIEINFQLHEAHNKLFQISADSLEDAVPALASDYGDFWEFYSRNIITIGSTSTIDYADKLKDFQLYVIGNGIDAAVQKKFPDTKPLKDQLHNAFLHYKYHFSSKPTPDIFTYISGFQQSIVITNEFIGISLDKYLGKDEVLYARTSIEKFKRKKMYPEKVAADCMMAIAMSEFNYNDSINNLLSHMVHQGKLLYFLDAMLPNTPDSIKIGYTARGMRWAEHNEKDVWDYLIAKKLLFSNNLMDIRKFTGEGPFTVPFTNNSPPQIAVWTGWQVVRAYMQNNPTITLKELMLNDNYQNILRYSRYKP